MNNDDFYLRECSFEDIVDELAKRFPKGVLVSIQREGGKYSIRSAGHSGILEQLAGHATQHVYERSGE